MTRQQALRRLHERLLEGTSLMQDGLNEMDRASFERTLVALTMLQNSGQVTVDVLTEEPLEIVLVKATLEAFMWCHRERENMADVTSGYIIEKIDGEFFVTGVNKEIFDEDRPDVAFDVASALEDLGYLETAVVESLSFDEEEEDENQTDSSPEVQTGSDFEGLGALFR